MLTEPTLEIESTPSRVAVANVLRRWVALGTYGPGDRLPTERSLAETLGVGRATVREAIRLLADEGLFATSRGRSGGTVVLDDNGRFGRGTIIAAALQQDVRDNFDFRLGVEPMAARLAAHRASRSKRRRISELSEGDATSYRMFRMLDSRFHLSVADAADNRLILAAVEQSRTEFFRWADAAWERVDWAALAPEDREFSARHLPIAEAVDRRDPDLAEERMRDHLLEGKEMFLAIIGEARRAGSQRITLRPAFRPRAES